MEEKILEMLNSEEYNNLARYYEHQTYLDILGVSRKEFAHSNFWYWLFDSKKNHYLGDYAIRKLLELCYNNLSKDLKEIIIKGNYSLDMEIAREVKASTYGYMDLLIKLKIDKVKSLNIIIENKIESSENSGQTLKYQEWYENSELRTEEALMLYFTPNIDEKISSEKFIKISYNELSNKILKYCLAYATNDTSKYLISDYMCCLSQPLINQTDEDVEDVNHSVLSINDVEKVNVHKLLDRYNTEILYLITALTDGKDNSAKEVYRSRFLTFKGIFNVILSETKDSELISKLNRILFNRIKTIEFNNKEYRPYGRKCNSIGHLVKDMIANYASNNNSTLNELKKLLDSKVWLSPWTDEVISKNVPNRPDHFYMKEEEKVKLQDCSVYVARYWISLDAIEMAKLLNQEIKIS